MLLYEGFSKCSQLIGVKIGQSVGYEFVFNYFEIVVLAEVDLGVTSLSYCIIQKRSTKFTQHILNLLPY